MNIKVIYGKMLVTMSHVFGVDFAKKFDTRLRFHRTLNLKNPTSLADKVTYVELHKQSSLASMCTCLLYTSPSPRDGLLSRMPSSA